MQLPVGCQEKVLRAEAERIAAIEERGCASVCVCVCVCVHATKQGGGAVLCQSMCVHACPHFGTEHAPALQMLTFCSQNQSVGNTLSHDGGCAI
jgi:hypothetical protein